MGTNLSIIATKNPATTLIVDEKTCESKQTIIDQQQDSQQHSGT